MNNYIASECLNTDQDYPKIIKKINFKHFINWIDTAAQSLDERTITNCFRKSKLITYDERQWNTRNSSMEKSGKKPEEVRDQDDIIEEDENIQEIEEILVLSPNLI